MTLDPEEELEEDTNDMPASPKKGKEKARLKGKVAKKKPLPATYEPGMYELPSC